MQPFANKDDIPLILMQRRLRWFGPFRGRRAGTRYVGSATPNCMAEAKQLLIKKTSSFPLGRFDMALSLECIGRSPLVVSTTRRYIRYALVWFNLNSYCNWNHRHFIWDGMNGRSMHWGYNGCLLQSQSQKANVSTGNRTWYATR